MISGTYREANFDGLVGPTHHYGGLATGNVASADHARQVSHPRQAARQGLDKMWALHRMGLLQGVLPPHERPAVRALRDLGFAGTDHEVVRKAARQAPLLLSAASSASAMWAANAATVSPSPDTADGRVHFTPANLSSHFHRALEAPTTARVLAATFGDPKHFAHHRPLPPGPELADEGAANHTRLGADYGDPAVELFTYGRSRFGAGGEPSPARQSVLASEAVARSHLLDPDRTLYTRQHPDAVRAGVFHNDVIAVGNRDLLFIHELAVDDLARLTDRLAAVDPGIRVLVVPDGKVSVAEAVRTYLFNSQLVSPGGDDQVLIAPEDILGVPRVRDYVHSLVGNGIDAVHTFDLRQSMDNGGGPACLRLRVVLNDDELAAVNPGSILDERLYLTLGEWIDRHYREDLSPDDLGDPALLDEGRAALDELTGILGLGAVYDFQSPHL